ncbi:hypothetical protein [Salinarimonas soli]|uniref:Uncharacterized protein n=1 Tax=Salinarimonas soli TaxID=1638099 RepID=A0A5B2V937_9HYPH|nr:hypothetical protein [Salinarimonas soli]KAA2234747.1 hypothetical protein F0L46_23035 [Salinarimonas soli]
MRMVDREARLQEQMPEPEREKPGTTDPAQELTERFHGAEDEEAKVRLCVEYRDELMNKARKVRRATTGQRFLAALRYWAVGLSLLLGGLYSLAE